MRNIEALMMGPKFTCEKCDLKLWQIGSTYFKVTTGYEDEDGNMHCNIKKVKI